MIGHDMKNAVLLCTALLLFPLHTTAKGSSGSMYIITDYARLVCEVHTSGVQLVISSQSNTPENSKIKISGANSVQTSLTANSRLGFHFMASDFPLTLEIITPEISTRFSLDQDCQLRQLTR
jgi:hypothetical protein